MPRELRMPSVMGPGMHRFGNEPTVSLRRSVFDRSHGHKLTFDAGFLVPVYVDDVMPGDTFHMSMTAFARLTTPLRPLQDNLYLDSFFFFVPYRLVWSNFVKFMGEQTNPGDSTSFVVPSIAVPFTPTVGSLMDYLGIMTQATATAIQTPNTISALPIRAYWLIYNQWFRDENLINSASVPTGDGPDAWTGSSPPVKRGKRHDYFTSCLPFLQKGTAVAAAVSPISVHAEPTFWANAPNNQSAGKLMRTGAAALTPVQSELAVANASTTALGWNDPALTVLISDLRQALAIQSLLERDARGGTRYTEIVRSHFGVESPDARLQRAEYLGGGTSQVVVSPIAQQTPVAAPPAGQGASVGHLGGYGTVTALGHGFHKSFTEHGVIIGLVNVRADLTYQQGVERYWFKQTRYDFFWPPFQFISEQAVLNQELWFQGTTAQNATDRAAFGYMPRYEEYRYKPSRISGLFRSNAAGTMEMWHLSEDFAALPTLGETFITDQTTSILARNLAVPSEPDFYCDIWFKLRCARPIPTFGVPGWGSRPF